MTRACEAHNLEVSRRRAEAVRRRLIESGVAPERIFIAPTVASA